MREKHSRPQSVDGKTSASVWSVWRQDDNGNIALVKSGLTQGEALRLTAELESGGHKQTYWVQEVQ